MGYDSRAEFYRRRYRQGDRILTPRELDLEIGESSARLNAVLDALRAGPLADRLVVFGSVARGRFLPGDVDVVVDLRKGPPVAQDDLGTLIDLAHANYGWLDPFAILPSGRLRVRSDRAICWTDAGNADAIKYAIGREGRALAEVSVSPDPSPAPYDLAAWEDPVTRRIEQLRRGWIGMTRGGWCRPESIALHQRRYLEAVAADESAEVRELFAEFSSEAPEALWRDLADAMPAPSGP